MITFEPLIPLASAAGTIFRELPPLVVPPHELYPYAFTVRLPHEHPTVEQSRCFHDLSIYMGVASGILP